MNDELPKLADLFGRLADRPIDIAGGWHDESNAESKPIPNELIELRKLWLRRRGFSEQEIQQNIEHDPPTCVAAEFNECCATIVLRLLEQMTDAPPTPPTTPSQTEQP